MSALAMRLDGGMMVLPAIIFCGGRSAALAALRRYVVLPAGDVSISWRHQKRNASVSIVVWRHRRRMSRRYKCEENNKGIRAEAEARPAQS